MSSVEDLSARSRAGQLGHDEEAELERQLERSYEARLLDRAGRQFDEQDLVAPGDEQIAARLLARWQSEQSDGDVGDGDERRSAPGHGSTASTSSASGGGWRRRFVRQRNKLLAVAVLTGLASSAAATGAVWIAGKDLRLTAWAVGKKAESASPSAVVERPRAAGHPGHETESALPPERGGRSLPAQLEQARTQPAPAPSAQLPAAQLPAAQLPAAQAEPGRGEAAPGQPAQPAQPAQLPSTGVPPERAQPASAVESGAGLLFREASQARREGRSAEARALYRRLIVEHPSSAEAAPTRVTLAQLHLQAGEPAAALPLFALYLQQSPGGVLAPEARWGRAQALGQLGRTTEAREMLRQLMRELPNSAYATAAEKLLARDSSEKAQAPVAPSP